MSFENKYAPQIWEDLVFADPDVHNYLASYARGKSFDHILLHGPHGAGKSEAAKVLAASSYGLAVHDVQLDMIEHVHEIKDAIKSWMAGGRFGHTCMSHNTSRPYALIHEVDRYEDKVQLKLRALMDTMSKARFIFTTNRLEDVDSGIRDRCDRFELDVPSPADFVRRAQSILQAEGVELNDSDVQELLEQGQHTIRSYLRALEKVSVEVRSSKAA